MTVMKRSLTQQFSLILLLGIVLFGGAVIYGFIALSDILETYDQALNRVATNERQILVIQNDFKKQVQEWKNVLLRGYDPKNLNKYWDKFEQKEAEISDKIDQLLPNLTHPEAKLLLNAFLSSHQSMGQAYREGLERFKAADYDPKVGDKVVKGIDRAPTDRLSEAATLISQEVLDKTQQLHAESKKITLLTSIFSLFAIAIFTTLGVILVKRQIIKPTQDISACLQRLAEGDFTVSELHQFDGELGDVACSVSQVKQHLSQIIQEVRQSTQNLTQASGSLTAITQNAQSDLLKQQSDIQQVATAMDQMSAVVTQVSGNTTSAADAAKQAANATREGREIVEGSISQISSLAEGVEDASRVIQQLEADVANIGTVLDVIRSIAEQTNLLALNAAIEAARAGEQGRGFAVVADEVRTLAGRTQESTSEIQEMIEKLEQGSAKAVKVMQESRHQAEQSVNQASSAGSSLDTIAQAVSSINEMNQQIATSAKEQASVTEEIHRNITNINQLSQHTTSRAQEIAAAGTSVSGLADNLNRLIDQFKV